MALGDEFPDEVYDEWCGENDCLPWRRYTHVGTYSITAADYLARLNSGEYCAQGTMPDIEIASYRTDTSFKDPNVPPTYEQMLAISYTWRPQVNFTQLSREDNYEYLMQYSGGNVDGSENELGGYSYNKVYPDTYKDDYGNTHNILPPEYLGGEWKWYQYQVVSAFTMYKKCTLACPDGSQPVSGLCEALPGYQWCEDCQEFVEIYYPPEIITPIPNQDTLCDRYQKFTIIRDENTTNKEIMIYLSYTGSTVEIVAGQPSILLPANENQVVLVVEIVPTENGVLKIALETFYT